MTSPGLSFFIVGCERSGTTLLRAMLDSHPEVCVPPESYFLVTLGDLPAYQPGAAFDAAAFARDLLKVPEFSRWQLSEAEVLAAVQRHGATSLAGASAAVYRAYADRAGKRVVGDKTPAYVMTIPRLAAMYPDAYFIHLIRDGRDVARSLVARSHKRPNSIGEAAVFWQRRVNRGRRDGELLGAGKYVEISYEDLTDRPAQTLESVCELIGVQYDESMLTYWQRGDDFARSHDYPDQHQNLTRKPSKSSSWADSMSRYDQFVFSRIAGDTLQTLGYSVPSPELGTGSKLTAILATERYRLGAESRAAFRAIRRRVAHKPHA